MTARTKPANVTAAAERSIRRHLVIGLATVALLGGGIGGLAATTELSGAVIAPGVFVVDSYVKKVQHPTGGIIGELDVRNGQKVEAGQLLARLETRRPWRGWRSW
ncbi:Type I secretion system membrane fusion protein PrsE [Methylobrevis pamukkalensis]|uniref:Type I secretion system membrane fusion protein PrsE n=1 Tax=Methylobrevis pamukkalensis TaxID=1439726 RepID=A0A1E3GNG6_9HYPH|nr:Type I secretion system membrane fusion protein PrsE [Methylobrevis pamukkalensis]